VPDPIYYRWCYSPSTGDVTLSHNHEAGPADIRFHSQMAEERPEHDVEVGYAFKMDNGWNVTDQDFKPVDDPHRLVAVENAIVQYEGRESPEIDDGSGPTFA
jgi:hypothetical protein